MIHNDATPQWFFSASGYFGINSGDTNTFNRNEIQFVDTVRMTFDKHEVALGVFPQARNPYPLVHSALSRLLPYVEQESVQRLIRILGYRPRPGIGAAGQIAALVTTGGEISGYCAIGSTRIADSPARMMKIERTAAKIGRSTKKCAKPMALCVRKTRGSSGLSRIALWLKGCCRHAGRIANDDCRPEREWLRDIGVSFTQQFAEYRPVATRFVFAVATHGEVSLLR